MEVLNNHNAHQFRVLCRAENNLPKNYRPEGTESVKWTNNNTITIRALWFDGIEIHYKYKNGLYYRMRTLRWPNTKWGPGTDVTCDDSIGLTEDELMKEINDINP